jgi:hypothetical protein
VGATSRGLPTSGSENFGARVDMNEPMPAPQAAKFGFAVRGELGDRGGFRGSNEECFDRSKGRVAD